MSSAKENRLKGLISSFLRSLDRTSELMCVVTSMIYVKGEDFNVVTPFPNSYYILVALLLIVFITVNEVIHQSYLGVPAVKDKEMSCP